MPHDFYHLPEYVAVEAGRMGGRAAAYFAQLHDDTILVPIVERTIPQGGGATDLSSPYGYPSPLVGDTDSQRISRLLGVLVEKMKNDGHCAAFLRMHPLIKCSPEGMEMFGTVVDHGETIWIDLRQPEEEQWGGYRSTNRNLIRRLRREGYDAHWDTNWRHYNEFQLLYAETMLAAAAPDWYLFGGNYFDALRVSLGNALRLFVVKYGDTVVAAGLFSEVGGIVEYHLSGADPTHRRSSPTRLMLDHVRSWASERGNWAFHLGGGVGGRADSLFSFKAGFSKQRTGFRTWRVVLDKDEYQRLVADWESRAGRPADSSDGFFPAYRKPVATSTGAA